MNVRLARLLGASSLVLLGIELVYTSQSPARSDDRGSKRVITTDDEFGELRSIFDETASLDYRNPFFKSFGTNGRACSTCHIPSDGWTITPETAKRIFRETKGMDPLFRTNDGSNSPDADCSTVNARKEAYSMLLNKGLIRVGIGIPSNAEFELSGCNDPYGYAESEELSLFRRPLPTTNLRFITGVMWDGRESFAPDTMPILSSSTPQDNRNRLIFDLMHQANDATLGHAQAANSLTQKQLEDIVRFEMAITTAQVRDKHAGALNRDGGKGGPANLYRQDFYVTINDVLGADVLTGTFNPESMTLYSKWLRSWDKRQAAIARGEALFNTKQIDITGVAGLNDDLNIPVIKGTCTSCHDAPNVGNHSVALPIDIGLTDASRRTPDMPLYTLRNKITGETRQTTDPGRALITGKWKDIGKFKGPVLRGLAARAPYFHNGMAADLDAAVDFYNERFGIGFTKQEKSDLVAFLKTL